MHSRCPVTANAIALQLLNNGRFLDADRDFARWTSREAYSLSRAATADSNLSSNLTEEKLEAAIKKFKSGKAPGRDNIHPEFVIHQSAKITAAWLCSLFTSCYRRSKLPKIWRQAIVVALPKPNRVYTCARPHVVRRGNDFSIGLSGPTFPNQGSGGAVNPQRVRGQSPGGKSILATIF